GLEACRAIARASAPGSASAPSSSCDRCSGVRVSRSQAGIAGARVEDRSGYSGAVLLGTPSDPEQFRDPEYLSWRFSAGAAVLRGRGGEVEEMLRSDAFGHDDDSS